MNGAALPGLVVLVRARLRVNRISLAAMAILMAIFCVAALQTYVAAFPDRSTRTTMLAPLVNNGALRVLYGYPFDIADPAGWVAWRTMTSAGIIMAMWAVVITSGALRGEEDAGRGELVLSGVQPRRRWFAAALTATAVQTVIIGAVMVIALAAVGLPQHLLTFANCAELGLQLMLPALFFAAVAALTSQLAPTARAARLLAAGILVAAFLVRAPADVREGMSWLRRLTPLGWFEELRPPAAPSPIVLTVIVLATALPILIALCLLGTRDIGRGLLGAHDSRPPRRLLLGSPWQAALRDETPQLSFWFAGTTLYALLMGGLIKTVLEFLRHTPMYAQFFGEQLAVDGFVSALYSLIQLLAALLAVTLIVAARGEEATGRLELLLAMPRSRVGWQCGRAVLAIALAATLTAIAAGSMWVGAALTGQRIRASSLLLASVNSLPLVVVTVGCATAVLALAPRAVSSMYALVAAAFLWDNVGTALQAPGWTLSLSPFHALARVPMQDLAFTPVAVLTVIGAGLFAPALYRFRHRDLISA
ncbi:hypothetical protein GFY24_09080 [Nocardia sp. SYP-A9097]|uniref:hypothetical protein n=1 Tax=Nocardia sp. SYP-A9097 TaxID=2663237 RepID=UPI00129C0940|nr:hypothetical protein [Nocardia sp. SYP-A9097]MRH87604.1 hypothetical protein [Nocardia sp. SYP-A9097]